MHANNTQPPFSPNVKALFLLFVAVGVALGIPFIAMQFTREVQWTYGDFITMGALVLSVGSVYLFLRAKVPKKYRFLVGIILALLFLYLWLELAVGVFTSLGS